jgi:cell filamentation protein
MTLENKLNIVDPVEFAREEERISKKKAKEMFEIGFLNSLEPGTFETLKKYRNICLRIYMILPVN